MASGQLQIDTDMLGTLGGELTGLSDTFNQADNPAEAMGDGLGDDDLAGQVRGFASSWARHRRALSDQVHTLGGNCQQAADQFIAADHQLATALSGTRATPTGHAHD